MAPAKFMHTDTGHSNAELSHAAARIAHASGDQQLMQCMEVWGGNDVVDASVSMSGLDAWVFSRPYEQARAGGDVYYVSACATGRITRLLVADVSGHGANVRDTAIVLRDLMRQYVNHLDQTRFVRSMNERFAKMSDAGSFATAVVTTFFAPTNYLTLCNAGHPSPLLYRARTKRWSLLNDRDDRDVCDDDGDDDRIENIPLGIEDAAAYRQFGVSLQVGDLVLCYSDSLIESHGADGEMLGEKGLLALLQTLAVDDPAKLVASLMSAITKLDAKNLDADDVTALLFRATGSPPNLTLKTRLLAPLRVTRGAMASVLRGAARSMPLPDFNLANLGGLIFPSLSRRWSAKRRKNNRENAKTAKSDREEEF